MKDDDERRRIDFQDRLKAGEMERPRTVQRPARESRKRSNWKPRQIEGKKA